MAIISFKTEGTRDIFELSLTKASRRILPVRLHRIAYLKLSLLDGANRLGELASVPGLRLEILKSDRKGQYSIRINEKYRICFYWNFGNVSLVEIIDYH